MRLKDDYSSGLGQVLIIQPSYLKRLNLDYCRKKKKENKQIFYELNMFKKSSIFFIDS
jgi:hypothetical protein